MLDEEVLRRASLYDEEVPWTGDVIVAVLAPRPCAVLGISFAPAKAQELPKKPITVIVGFAAGGAADAAARIIAKKLQDELGQPVVVDNRRRCGRQHRAPVPRHAARRPTAA